MTGETLRILLIEDNPGDARLLEVTLSEVLGRGLELDVQQSLSGGVQRLAREAFSVVLLDLNLPDSQGLDTLERLLGKALRTPIVVLTGLDDAEAGNRAVQMGAQDYVVKGQVSGELLGRLLRHAIERKRTSERQALTQRVLSELNQSQNGDAIANILEVVKDFTRFDAVGLRLRDGEDYPYYETRGFSRRFVEKERLLCRRDACGEVERDEQGNPVLDCMCGAVICGRADPAKPYFSQSGSFWTNSTTELLSTTPDVERGRTRNRCNGEGYESVALVPLRSGEEILGLMQLNDPSSGRFDVSLLTTLEELAASVGIVLGRRMAEQELRYRTRQLAERVKET
jgi:DNA-binding NarL/FixJ family response regulator